MSVVGAMHACAFTGPPASVSGPRGSFGDGRAMRTAVASKFRQSAGDGTLRIGEMRGSHPCAWHSAAATCGAAVALSALASLLGDWGRSPQQAGACLTLWSEVPEENWPFLLKILAMSVMGAGDALAMSPRRLPSFSQPWLAMAFGQSPARAVFWPDFASIWRFRQLSETLPPARRPLRWRRPNKRPPVTPRDTTKERQKNALRPDCASASQHRSPQARLGIARQSGAPLQHQRLRQWRVGSTVYH